MNTSRIPDPRRAQQRGTAVPIDTIGPVIDLTQAEIERGGIAAYARAVVRDDKHEMSFFRELTAAVEEKTKRRARNHLAYMIPGDCLQQRDLTKATATAGGFLVGADIHGFSTALNNALVLAKLPVTKLPNLTGDVVIGRESLKGTAGWLASENTTMPDAQATYGQIALTAKTVAAAITCSRHFVLQTALGPQLERALATALAEKVDAALVAGSGASGEPTGLANMSGVDTRTGASFTHAMSSSMLKAASGWEASDSIAWIAGVDAAEDLQTRERATGSGFIADNGQVLNRSLHVSRSVGAQVLLCAPWSLVWWATWGALEIAVDPFTAFTSGKVTIRAMWTMDFACERPASVAIATALT
jgi:HK97 family phage major capsid protein